MLKRTTMATIPLSAFSATQNELSQRREIGGFIVEDIQYHSGRQLPRHRHPFSALYVLRNGQGREIVGRGERKLSAGSAIFRLANDQHSAVYEAATGIIAIVIPQQRLGQRGEHGRIIDGPVFVSSASLALLAEKISSNLDSEDVAATLTVEGAVLEMLGEVFGNRIAGEYSHAVIRAENILKDTFRQPSGLGSLATAVGVDATYLAREFRRVRNITVGEYLRKLRIQYVCQRLASCSISLSDLAQEAGFADHSHLSRTFRALMGVSPSRFRAAARPAHRQTAREV